MPGCGVGLWLGLGLGFRLRFGSGFVLRWVRVRVVDNLWATEHVRGREAKVSAEEMDNDAASDIEDAQLDEQILVNGENDDLDEGETQELEGGHLPEERWRRMDERKEVG